MFDAERAGARGRQAFEAKAIHENGMSRSTVREREHEVLDVVFEDTEHPHHTLAHSPPLPPLLKEFPAGMSHL